MLFNQKAVSAPEDSVILTVEFGSKDAKYYNPSQPSLKKGRVVVSSLLRDGRVVILRTQSEESNVFRME